MRDAFQVARGYHKQRRDEAETLAQVHRERRKGEAIQWAQLYSMLAGLAGEKRKPREFLPDEMDVETGGMTKERLRRNYEVEAPRQKERERKRKQQSS